MPQARGLRTDQCVGDLIEPGHENGEDGAPQRNHQFESRIPTPSRVTVGNPSPQRVSANRKSAEERGQDGENGNDFMAKRGRQLRAPEHLPGKRHGTREHHQNVRQQQTLLVQRVDAFDEQSTKTKNRPKGRCSGDGHEPEDP